jgi:hypothetical protein
MADWREIQSAAAADVPSPTGLHVRVSLPNDATSIGQWVLDYLCDPAVRVWSLVDQGNPVGWIRVDVVNGIGTLRFSTSPSQLGFALNEMRRHLSADYQVRRLVCPLIPDGERQAAFLAAGFTVVDHGLEWVR